MRRHLIFDAAQLLNLFTPLLPRSWTTVIRYCSPKHVIKQLQRMQNGSCSCCYSFAQVLPYYTVLLNFHWLLIDIRIEFKILIVTNRILHRLAPAPLKDLLQSYFPAWDLLLTLIVMAVVLFLLLRHLCGAVLLSI